MSKKMIYISFILSAVFSSEIFAYATYAMPELDQALNYVYEDRFEQAEAIYNSLLANPPDQEAEILAHSGLILIDIRQGNITTAKTTADALIADYSSNEIVSAAAFDIANAFLVEAEQTHEAGQYFHYVIDNWPDSEDGFSARFGAMRSSVLLQFN